MLSRTSATYLERLVDACQAAADAGSRPMEDRPVIRADFASAYKALADHMQDLERAARLTDEPPL